MRLLLPLNPSRCRGDNSRRSSRESCDGSSQIDQERERGCVKGQIGGEASVDRGRKEGRKEASAPERDRGPQASQSATMITIRDVYNVLSAVVPLYVAMLLAYGSVKWWKIFTPEQCSGINRFVALFAVPLLSFDFISKNDPFSMVFRFLAADCLAKVIILAVLVLWVRFSRSGSLEWMITLFSLATLPNSLVMGIPLLTAMYGRFSGQLMVQIVVLQCIIWYTLLLFLFEYRGARILISEQFPQTAASIVSFKVESDVVSLDGREPLQAEAEIGDDGKIHVTVRKSTSSRSVISSRRSQGLTSLPSSKALTPRPSNMTGAEIYSLHSSRNPTPRGSSFNHTDFYSMLAGRPVSPRQSNFAPSDVYSLHSSRGPTPRTSNFEEENSKDFYTYERGAPNITSPRFPPPSLYSPGRYAYGARNPGATATNFDLNPQKCVAMNPASQNAFPGSNGGIMSPNASRQMKTTGDPKASPKPNEDVKELHMFVWSSSASPVSEGGLPVFGGRDFGAPIDNTRPEQNSKEVRMIPLPPNENETKEGMHDARESYEEYAREEFSFGNRAMSQDESLPHDKDGPSLSKLGSSSTVDLTPKLHGDGKQLKMPPAKVMTKLILVMVWRKLIRNPNTYSSLLGVIWSLVASRWGIGMPKIVSKSISILSNAGLGMAMFSLGLFMALQPKIIACGNSVATFAMAVRFLTGPAVVAASSIIIGLRGVLLHVAIVQAALPQGIVPFVFAKEYNVHPDILSTGVVFGMLIALPITMLYYFLLGL